MVTSAKLERSIEKVRSMVKDPNAGLYGPGSIVWKVNRESILFLGGGRATLLQLAHPFVGQGVDQHSKTRHDPSQRFHRTFLYVFSMNFGTLDEAIEASQDVFDLHAKVKGKIGADVGAFKKGARYDANDEEALFWVHATLIDTSLLIYEQVVAPLTLAEKEDYYQETRKFAYLFGMPDSVIPPDYVQFCEYMRKMIVSDTITVGSPAHELGNFLFRPNRVDLRALMGWYRTITAGLLPEKLRKQFGFHYGWRQQVAFRASMAGISAAYRALPAKFRHLTRFSEAQVRLGLDQGGLLQRAGAFAGDQIVNYAVPRPGEG